MSLITEDGTGKADAEAYISVADATTYFAARGVAAWAALASDTIREQLLRKATEYMSQTFRQQWNGVRVYSTQALDWPRAGVCVDGYAVDSDVVPVEVQRACAELALKANTADLLADLEQAVIREKIGPIETEYAPGSSPNKRYVAVDRMLRPYLSGGDASIRLVRA